MTVIELEPVDYYCRHCDSVMEWTACTAPRCTGYRCLGCDWGCDLTIGDDSDCATALANRPCAAADDWYELRSARHARPLRVVALPGECS